MLVGVLGAFMCRSTISLRSAVGIDRFRTSQLSRGDFSQLQGVTKGCVFLYFEMANPKR